MCVCLTLARQLVSEQYLEERQVTMTTGFNVTVVELSGQGQRWLDENNTDKPVLMMVPNTEVSTNEY